MKAISVILALSATLLGEEAPTQTKQLTPESITHTAALLRAVDEHAREFDSLIDASKEPKSQLSATSLKRLETLRKEFHDAMVGVVQIKKTVQKGHSVFEYPGLLTLGTITYNMATKTYCLSFLGGITHEGEVKYPFEVFFDRSRSILSFGSPRPTE